MKISHRDEIERLLHHEGAVSRRQHPDLARTLSWLAESGRVTAILPGVYVRADAAVDPGTRIRALALAEPNAVLTQHAAAVVSFWPDLRVDTVVAAVPSKRHSPAGFRLERRSIPSELVSTREDLYLTAPALTALDLVPSLGGDGIDQALRTGAATLDDLRVAMELTPNRRGNHERMVMLRDSRDAPWAASERLLHRLLREAGLVGWDTNRPVRLPEGLFYVDALFEVARLAIEIDGWEFHARRPADFEATLHKHTALESAGWRVLHFTWAQLTGDPAWVLDKIRQALEWDDRPLIQNGRLRPRLAAMPRCW